MPESYYFIIEFIRSYTFSFTINGVLFLIFNKYVLKLYEFEFIHTFLKWFILFTAIGYSLELSLAFFNGYIEKDLIFCNRAFGEHYSAYWFMIFMSAIFPLLLFLKNLGNSLMFLVIVVLGMNIGRIIEFFIIIISNYHIDKM